MRLSKNAVELMSGISKMYIDDGYPQRQTWMFSPENDLQRRTFNELTAHGLIEPKTLGGGCCLSEEGLQYILAAAEDEEHDEGDEMRGAKQQPDRRKVFLIHGRNDAAQKEMRTFLRSLGLIARPFDDIRHGLPGNATIMDVIQAGMKESQGVIALFTADEFASLRPDFRGPNEQPREAMRWQARPNVIFEAGLAYGLAPDRFVFVLLGDVELFSDVSGIHFYRISNDPRRRFALRQFLANGMGCDVEHQSSEWQEAGDFDSCVKALPGARPHDPFAEAPPQPVALPEAAFASSPRRGVLDPPREYQVNAVRQIIDHLEKKGHEGLELRQLNELLQRPPRDGIDPTYEPLSVGQCQQGLELLARERRITLSGNHIRILKLVRTEEPPPVPRPMNPYEGGLNPYEGAPNPYDKGTS